MDFRVTFVSKKRRTSHLELQQIVDIVYTCCIHSCHMQLDVGYNLPKAIK